MTPDKVEEIGTKIKEAIIATQNVNQRAEHDLKQLQNLTPNQTNT